jgi:hypothetical protein
MKVVRTFFELTTAMNLAGILAAVSLAQAQWPERTLEHQLESQYILTTPTADNTDIVSMGSVLILQKRGFSAGAVSNKVPAQNTYKDGQIKAGVTGVIQEGCRIYAFPGCDRMQSAVGPSRDFVNGETLYVTRISVDRSKDTIIFYLISAAYGNAGRFNGSLTFQFPRGSVASADLARVQPTIGEVFRIAPTDGSSGTVPQRGQQASQVAPVQTSLPVTQPQPDAPLPPILPPPPPPPDLPASVSIEVGQTRDQVVSILGKPDKIVKDAGTKEIYQYKNIEVTFVSGKMTDAH